MAKVLCNVRELLGDRKASIRKVLVLSNFDKFCEIATIDIMKELNTKEKEFCL